MMPVTSGLARARTIAVWIFICAAVLVVAAVLGTLWWGLWMNHSWPGATGLLAKILHADGEYYYDAMQYEMTLWALLCLASLAAIIRRRRGEKRG